MKYCFGQIKNKGIITNRSTVKSFRQEKSELRWECGDAGRMQRNGRYPSLKGKRGFGSNEAAWNLGKLAILG